ncbi:diguanylate cyclase [Desulfobulbus rhabdoformis]|uniref:GGDEF domain-containing protein n=1 Tax=Desulfobulbus rhabdoformis TaxID=34032 RepID=UPI001964F67D|nr:GGDEF domain-containing protein [Desulfobulbus rhabdoformis]MBM9615865.1 diguanylate cyclase [Desulfobulbus rhabdoformis]
MARTLEKAIYQLGLFSHEFTQHDMHDSLQSHYSELRATLEDVESLTVTLSQEGNFVDILSLNLASQAIRSHAAIVFQLELNITQQEAQVQKAVDALKKVLQVQGASFAEGEISLPYPSVLQEMSLIVEGVGRGRTISEVESHHAHLRSLLKGGASQDRAHSAEVPNFYSYFEGLTGGLEALFVAKEQVLDALANLNILLNELDELSRRLERLTETYVENVFEQYKVNSRLVISEIEGATRVKLLFGLLSIVVLCLLYFIIVIRGFGGRLSMISKAMSGDSVEKGEWTLPLEGNDEISAMARSASALLDKARRLRELATIDELTQAYNRRSFFELATKEAKRASRTKQGAVFLMIDLDHFKLINDTYGHDFGDKVLQEIARACHQTIREIDIFARYGGEEFVLLMPETSLGQGEIAAQRILTTVASLDFSEDGAEPVHITASIGLAEADLVSIGIDTALKHADKALYLAKDFGRNRVEIFQEE